MPWGASPPLPLEPPEPPVPPPELLDEPVVVLPLELLLEELVDPEMQTPDLQLPSVQEVPSFFSGLEQVPEDGSHVPMS